MKNIAIKPGINTGKEIIEYLISLGGVNDEKYIGDSHRYYYIGEHNIIRVDDAKGYILLEKIPLFKVGDKVRIKKDSVYKIQNSGVGVILNIISDSLPYAVNFDGGYFNRYDNDDLELATEFLTKKEILEEMKKLEEELFKPIE